MNARMWLVLAGLGLAACGPDKTPGEPPPPPVLTGVVHFEPPGALASYPGEVRARHDADLAFRVAGKLVERPVDVGAAVRRGTLLARIDPADVALAARAAEAQSAAAASELRLAAADLARARSLFERGYIAQAALDARAAGADAARQRLAQARAQAAVAGNQAGYARLAADHDGVVTAVLAEPGQVVAAGQPVLRLARPDEREVWISVPEGRVDEFRAAASLAVVLLAEPARRYRGRLRELAPSADPATRTFSAKVAIADADERVRLGMSASVLAGAGAGAALARLPLAALSSRAAQPVLWVIDAAGTLHARPVEVAGYTHEWALIRAGVAEGERVVVAGVHKLAPGLAVRAVEAPARPR